MTRVRGLGAGFLAIILLSVCASTPPVNADIAEAASRPGRRDSPELLARQIERIAGRGFIAGSRVDLLRDGPATYAAMTAAILAATYRIDMESYTFDTGQGAWFADLMLRKRAKGLEVHLIFDAVGSSGSPQEVLDRLRAAGVACWNITQSA